MIQSATKAYHYKPPELSGVQELVLPGKTIWGYHDLISQRDFVIRLVAGVTRRTCVTAHILASAVLRRRMDDHIV